MAEGEHIELKFRIYDGTDIAHNTYSSSTTIATLKQKLIAEWPQGLSFYINKNIFNNVLSLTIFCGVKL